MPYIFEVNFWSYIFLHLAWEIKMIKSKDGDVFCLLNFYFYRCVF